MTARLDPVSPRVDLTVSLTNHAKDHRLRIAFPTGVRGSFSRAEGIFSVDSRPIEVGELAGSEDYADWVEPPDGYHPQKSFVDVSDGATGIAIANKGLPEFQVSQQSEESTILVTLLRSVGWLSRPDLQTRKGNGGWTVPTEGAQCLGSYTFELSLIPHAGDWRVGRVAELAHRFITPPLVRPVCGARSARTLPTELSLVSCDSEDIVISALKRSEEQEQLVARLVNLTSETQTANLRFAVGSGDVYELGLNERITGSLPLGVDNRVDLRFRPWEIKTVAIAVGTKNGRPNTPSAKETS
jgi:alpha-mannosidase